MNDKQKEYSKKSRFKHIEKRREYDIKRYNANKEHWKQYYEANKEERLKACKAYKKTNICKKAAREYINKRLRDPEYRLIHNLRCRLKAAFMNGGYKKTDTTKKLLGCTPNELKIHFESQFKEGMSWDNYGEWHVDHIKPVSSFNMADVEQQKQCFHYTNLQPLWAMENFLKSDNV